MIQALLFDKDGTLFDFDATWGHWATDFIIELSDGDVTLQNQLADIFHLDLNARKFHPTSPIIAETNENVFMAVLEVLPSISKEELMAKAQHGSANAALVPVCDLSKLFNELTENYPLGIATNDSEVSATSQLKRAGVFDYFAFVAGCDSGFGAKPDAGMCLGFATHTGIAPENIVMIGDSTHDLRAARAAGMIALGVLTGPASREELLPFADDVIASIEELPAWLAGRR